MYVKLFTQILDSSIADDRRLRHFFTDLLLCADSKGIVMMTKAALARRIGCDLNEVEWGIRELQRPDPQSKTPDQMGRRIEPMEGSGYGWRVLNYEHYRAMKDADQMREAANERVKRFREKKKLQVIDDETPCNAGNANTDAETEGEAESSLKSNVSGPTYVIKSPEPDKRVMGKWDKRSKEEKLYDIPQRENMPTEKEFKQFLEDEDLYKIIESRPDLYHKLCQDRWHQWNDDLKKWVPIKYWKRFVRGLEDVMKPI